MLKDSIVINEDGSKIFMIAKRGNMKSASLSVASFDGS